VNKESKLDVSELLAEKVRITVRVFFWLFLCFVLVFPVHSMRIHDVASMMPVPRSPQGTLERVTDLRESWGELVSSISRNVENAELGRHISLAGIAIKRDGEFGEVKIFPHVFVSGVVLPAIKRDMLGFAFMDMVEDDDFWNVFRCISSYGFSCRAAEVHLVAHSERAACLHVFREDMSRFVAVEDETIEEILVKIYNIKRVCQGVSPFFEWNNKSHGEWPFYN
jgi:hypothetical protein